MKAIRAHEFGPADVMKLEETATPHPGPGQLVVHIHAIGVNPVDTYILAGKHGKIALPYTPGKDAAGTVESIGPGAGNFKTGDRVYTSNSITGTYAQFALCQVRDVHRLPDNASFAQGASLGVPAGVACFALFFRAQARPGDNVLVHGATGAVGTAAVQLARHAGMNVFATAGDDKGRDLLLKLGAHHVFGHDITRSPDKLKSLTQGRGIDVILEIAAHKNLADDLDVLSDRGRVAVIGSRGPIEIDPRKTMQNNADICGVTLEKITPEENHAIYALLTASLADKTLQPILAAELPLDQAIEAHKQVMSNHAPGKIILRPPDSLP